MLVSMVMVVAMFSAAVTSREGSDKSSRRLMANQAAAQLTAQLKSYVTACGCNPATGDCAACGTSTILGPNTNNAGVATWYLNGGSLVDAAAPPNPNPGAGRALYALACGDHYVTGLMPQLEGPPRLIDPANPNGGYIGFYGYTHYLVTYPGGCPTAITLTSAPKVTVDVNWTEP